MVEALTGFVDRAKTSGTIYAALYELGDEELIAKLEGPGERLQIVLSNSVDQTRRPGKIGRQPGRTRPAREDGRRRSGTA